MNTHLGTKVWSALGLLALLAAVSLAPSPRLRDRANDVAERAWSAWLEQTFDPVMADCIRFEVEAHVPTGELEALLRMNDDPFAVPRLRPTLDRATLRCSRRHATPELGE